MRNASAWRIEMETRKAPQEQHKVRVNFSPSRVHTIGHEKFEDYLDNVDRYRTCIEGMAAIVDVLDPSRLHHESEELIEEAHGNIAAGLAVILAVCATEMRIDMENFRHDNPPDNEGGLQ
jgi:hypothetical protein